MEHSFWWALPPFIYPRGFLSRLRFKRPRSNGRLGYECIVHGTRGIQSCKGTYVRRPCHRHYCVFCHPKCALCGTVNGPISRVKKRPKSVMAMSRTRPSRDQERCEVCRLPCSAQCVRCEKRFCEVCRYDVDCTPTPLYAAVSSHVEAALATLGKYPNDDDVEKLLGWDYDTYRGYRGHGIIPKSEFEKYKAAKDRR